MTDGGGVASGEESAARKRADARRGRGTSGREETEGAGDVREVDVASPREVQSFRHALD